MHFPSIPADKNDTFVDARQYRYDEDSLRFIGEWTGILNVERVENSGDLLVTPMPERGLVGAFEDGDRFGPYRTYNFFFQKRNDVLI